MHLLFHEYIYIYIYICRQYCFIFIYELSYGKNKGTTLYLDKPVFSISDKSRNDLIVILFTRNLDLNVIHHANFEIFQDQGVTTCICHLFSVTS